MMEYRNDSVRRQDRLLGEERARELLRGGVVSTMDGVMPPESVVTE